MALGTRLALSANVYVREICYNKRPAKVYVHENFQKNYLQNFMSLNFCSYEYKYPKFKTKATSYINKSSYTKICVHVCYQSKLTAKIFLRQISKNWSSTKVYVRKYKNFAVLVEPRKFLSAKVSTLKVINYSI